MALINQGSKDVCRKWFVGILTGKLMSDDVNI